MGADLKIVYNQLLEPNLTSIILFSVMIFGMQFRTRWGGALIRIQAKVIVVDFRSKYLNLGGAAVVSRIPGVVLI